MNSANVPFLLSFVQPTHMGSHHTDIDIINRMCVERLGLTTKVAHFLMVDSPGLAGVKRPCNQVSSAGSTIPSDEQRTGLIILAQCIW